MGQCSHVPRMACTASSLAQPMPGKQTPVSGRAAPALGGGGLEGRFWGGAGGGLAQAPKAKQAPLTSPCPPSYHTITPNLTLTFVVSWFSHASHVG